jgi:hypothetical protein
MTLEQFLALGQRATTTEALKENFRTNSWSSHYPMKTICFDDLSSAFLDTNPMFQDLKS